jgi:type I restriction enzyme M protein
LNSPTILFTKASLKRRSIQGLEKETRTFSRLLNCESLINCDKVSLDIFWLRDESLEVSDNLPDPDVLAQEIVNDLEAALEQFREIATFSCTDKEFEPTWA